jgi:hypothetical protein
MATAAFSSTARRLWERYTVALIANPLLVKGSTASAIFFVSDSFTQQFSGVKYDLARAGSGAYSWLMVYGVVGLVANLSYSLVPVRCLFQAPHLEWSPLAGFIIGGTFWKLQWESAFPLRPIVF